MPDLARFDLPAFQQDLAGEQQEQMQNEWSASVNRWTETALLGNPWTVLNDQNRDYYYNPLNTGIAGGTGASVTATVTDFQSQGSGGEALQLFTLSLAVDENAEVGDRSLLLKNPDGRGGPAAPGVLSVVPPGSLGRGKAAAGTAAEEGGGGDARSQTFG